MNRSLIVQLETMSFRALPALKQELYDGWVLRFADGYTGRANSINPIHESTKDTSDKIRHCEMLYTAANLPTMFKLTPALQPSNLDNILQDSGYGLRDNGHTYVYSTSLTGAYASSDKLTIYTQPVPLWFNAYTRMNNVPENHHLTLRRIQQLIDTPCAYILLKQDETIAAVALGVLDGEWLGIYDVVVAPELRRQGYARLIMNGLMAWGMTKGARQAYLQVVVTNQPAIMLYQSLGFDYLYEYWYRMKPLHM